MREGISYNNIDTSRGMPKRSARWTANKDRLYNTIQLKALLQTINAEKANVIRDYILAEETDINIKESTEEGKIKIIDMVIKLLGQQAFWSNDKARHT